jgi:uncharacterized alkaline shock family protein YloU
MKETLVFEEALGPIVVPPQTLAAIVTRAVEDSGARVRRRPRRSLEVEIDGPSAQVAVGLVAPYGVVLPELAGRVQERVRELMTTMLELERVTVNVTVEEIA